MGKGSRAGADERAGGAAAGAFDWQAAITRYDRRVVVSLLAMGLGVDQAKDIAQETWLKLVEKERRGELREVKLPGLAIKQARYLALEARRGRRNHTTVEEVPELPDRMPRIEETVAGRRDLARAERALADCSPRAQEVFGLIYGPGAPSHAEAAEQLGISVQRLRQTLCEVRKRLRIAMKDDHD